MLSERAILFSRIRKGVSIALFILLLSGNVYGQKHGFSSSINIVHINQDSDSFFNARGFSFGHIYFFKNGSYLSSSFTTTNLFNGDTSKGSLSTEALLRRSFYYYGLETNFHLKLFQVEGFRFTTSSGLSVRLAYEVEHFTAFFAGSEENTSQIPTTTEYDRRFDLGLNFGFAIDYSGFSRILPKFSIDYNNYGSLVDSQINLSLGIAYLIDS